MSDETRKNSALLASAASVIAILAFLGKGVWVAMEVHADLNGARHDLNNAIRQLERIENKLDVHDRDINALKAKVGIVWNEKVQTVGGGNK